MRSAQAASCPSIVRYSPPPARQQHRLRHGLLPVRVVGDHAAGEAEGLRGGGEGEAVLQAPVQEGAGAFAAGGGEGLQPQAVGAGFGAARPGEAVAPVADLDAGELGRIARRRERRLLQPRAQVQLRLGAVRPSQAQRRPDAPGIDRRTGRRYSERLTTPARRASRCATKRSRTLRNKAGGRTP
jgi:hypothetical protein